MLGGYDAGMFVIDPPRNDRCDPSSYDAALASIVSAGQATGKPAFAVASLPENMDEGLAMRLMDQGVVPLSGLEAALGAIAASQVPAGLPGWRPLAVVPGEGAMLDEAASKALLAQAGVAVPKGVVLDALKAVALTPPYVLKGLGFAHKTENGAVRLGLSSLNGQADMPGATGYLVEEMVTGVVAEVLIGVRRDAVYGATLTVGFGGVTAELLADTVTMVCPVTGPEVVAALQRLRLWLLLEGYRGRPMADVAAVVDVALRVQGMLDGAVTEIEINPLMVRAQGAVAVDAVIWRKP
jgi:acetate---CoA ligase (ADP-forming)